MEKEMTNFSFYLVKIEIEIGMEFPFITSCNFRYLNKKFRTKLWVI